MSLRILGMGMNPAHVDEAEPAPTAQSPFGPQGHHHRHQVHQAQKSGNRARTKRRRGADSADGVDETGASEELQMMLTEHLQRQTEFVMRVAEQQSGERGRSGGDERQRDDEDDTPLRAAKRRATERRFLLSAEAAGDAGDAAHARAAAESALLHARETRARPEAKPSVSSTYLVLAIMREFLSLPHSAPHAAHALAHVRQRLIDAVDTPTGRAPAQQESINLLLPLMLLNLERVRTDVERALAVAKIGSLLDRRRSSL